MDRSSKDHKTVNPYTVLGIDRKAALGEVKRAYFKLVREYPPEDHPEEFKKIREAYEQLKSPEKRAQADFFLFQPPPELPKKTAGRYDLTVHPEDMIRLALELRVTELDLEQDFREPKRGE